MGQLHRRYSAGFLLLALLLIAAAGRGDAAADNRWTAQICDRATIRAARDRGVPLDVLKAISRTESGRPVAGGLQPWPWTVNMEGAGRWFASQDEARAFVFSHFKNGARSFDVGCFQINFKWHGQAFRSIDDMFDPDLNARYAADFLAELYREFGNWPDAAGAYHSRTPEFASRYTARFNRIRAGLDRGVPAGGGHGTGTGALRPLTAAPGLLISSGSTAMGSLVPLRHGPGPAPFVVLD